MAPVVGEEVTKDLGNLAPFHLRGDGRILGRFFSVWPLGAAIPLAFGEQWLDG